MKAERIESGSAAREMAEPLRATFPRTHPIAVTGAAGFVGSHTCRALVRRGFHVRALVRHAAKAAARLGDTRVELTVGDLRDAAFVSSALAGAGAVVHLAAIAIERPGQSYERVNTEATVALLEAAHAAGVARVVHMSQNGASSASSHPFLRSKGLAEDAVRTSDRRWTVLRPSVIFGPEDEFVNVLARLVRLSPIVYPLPAGGVARFQPVFVDDVATAICESLERESAVGGVYGLGGPEVLTLREMAARVLIAMHTRRIMIGVSVNVLRPLVALAQRAFPNPPVTTSLLELLELDNTVRDNAIVDTFGITPTPFTARTLGYLQRISAADALRSLFAR